MTCSLLPIRVGLLLVGVVLSLNLSAALMIVVDPDEVVGVSDGADISSAFVGDGVALAVLGSGLDPQVYAVEGYSLPPPAGAFGFGWGVSGVTDGHWNRPGPPGSPMLQATFTGFKASAVSIDCSTDGTITLEAFGASGSLGSVSSTLIGDKETLTYDAGSQVIEYVQVSGDHAGVYDFGTLDHMVIVPEPSQVALFAGLGLLGFGAIRSRRQARSRP